ncbi:MAG: hypothetical protein ACD_75C02646G0001, partial [uncultured bacterium]
MQSLASDILSVLGNKICHCTGYIL